MADVEKYIIAWYNKVYTRNGVKVERTNSEKGITLKSSEIIPYYDYFKYVHFLFDIRLLNSHEEVFMLFSEKEFEEFQSFIKEQKLEQYQHLIAYLLGNMYNACAFARIYDNPDWQDGIELIRELKTHVPKFIEFLESYFNSNMKGEENDTGGMRLHSISFKSYNKETFTINNPYLTHGVMKAIFEGHSLLNTEIFEVKLRDEWKEKIRQEYMYVDTKATKYGFIRSLVLSLRNFYVGEGIHEEVPIQSLPNSLGKLILRFLEFSPFNIIDEDIELPRLRNWYVEALSQSEK